MMAVAMSDPVPEGGPSEGAVGAGADPVVLDPSVLDALLRGDQEKIARLGRKFLDTTSAAVDQMLEAASEGDHDKVGRLAHSLKSAAATVGAPRLATASEELESACERGDGALVGPLVSTIAALAVRVAVELAGPEGEESR